MININVSFCYVLCQTHGIITTTFKIDNVVGSFLYEEMQKKSFEMAKKPLISCIRMIEKGNKKENKGKSKSSGRSNSCYK